MFTHDSVGVGEDGPTHEPIEHLMALRAVPHMTDFRPADANETAAAWRLALERKGPCFFALTRQDIPVIDATKRDIYAECEQGRVRAGRRQRIRSCADRDGVGSLRWRRARQSCLRLRESARGW